MCLPTFQREASGLNIGVGEDTLLRNVANQPYPHRVSAWEIAFDIIMRTQIALEVGHFTDRTPLPHHIRCEFPIRREMARLSLQLLHIRDRCNLTGNWNL